MMGISLFDFPFVLKGISGKKVSYTSLPFKFMTGFTVESAGMFKTAKAKMYTSSSSGEDKQRDEYQGQNPQHADIFPEEDEAPRDQ